MLACLFLLTLALGAPPARAQTDALASAHDALRSGDLAAAAQGHRDYLQSHPDAADASKEALHLAWILYKEKVPDSDIRKAFQDVCDKYAGTAEAATAGFSLANYAVKDKRYDLAIQRFATVAAEPAAPPNLAAEALLETGFMHVENYFAEQFVSSEGVLVADPSDLERAAMLQRAAQRLAEVARELAARADETGVCRTAAAYAECGAGEVELLLGRPYVAERWYRSALKRCDGTVEPPVRTLATLGLRAALYHEGRYLACLKQMDDLLAEPATGKVLYSLTVPEFVVAHAHLWQAASYQHLGKRVEAKAAAESASKTLVALTSIVPADSPMTVMSVRATKLADAWLAALRDPQAAGRERIAARDRNQPLPGGSESDSASAPRASDAPSASLANGQEGELR